MAEELKNDSKAESLEPDEPEKLELEDIISDNETEAAEDLDLEEAVSEEEPKAEKSESKAVVKKEVKVVTREAKKEKAKEPEPDALERAEAEKVKSENQEKPENKVVIKKHSWLKTVGIVLLTMLVTAAAVLGAVWWFYQNGSKTAEEPKVETKVAEETGAKTETELVYVNAREGLNLRKEASATTQLLALIPYGTELTVTETQGDWIKTTYQNLTGWVFKEFVTKTKPFDASWKTYSGSGFDSAAPKFSIKYPSDWTIDDYKIQKVDGGKTYKISLGEGGHGFTEDETITSTQENVTYNGNPAKKTVIKRSGEIIFISVQFVKSTTYTTQIEFWVPEGYNPTYLNLFEQILSTITFS